MADSAVRPSVRVCCCARKPRGGYLCLSVHWREPVGFSVGDSLSYAIQQSQVPDMPLYRVYNALETQGIDPVLPAVSLAGEQVQLDGCALFSGETCSGWLNREQTAVLSLLLHSGEQAVLYDDGESLVLRAIRVRRSVVEDACEIQVSAESRVRPMSRYAARLRVAQEQCTRVIERLKQAVVMRWASDG